MRGWHRDALCAAIALIFGIVIDRVFFFSRPALADDSLALTGAREMHRTEVVVDTDGTVHFPPMMVPFSNFASPEAKKAFLENLKYLRTLVRLQSQTTDVAELRRMEADHLRPVLERTRVLYPVESIGNTGAGVYTDVITPKGGVTTRNKNRVLINLHGGGFLTGARILGALESIPVASLGKIKVVTVDYRQGPEYKFPAASEDVAAVYRNLLIRYKPENIGIYGCSAGGVLTAESMAWIEKENLPSPGAIGIFCASAAGWIGGDSGSLAFPLSGFEPPRQSQALSHSSVSDALYFSNVDINDPLVTPIRSSSVLARFPPTLIVTSTRDGALSPAVYAHTQLTKLGVDAELHIWEGVGHGFFVLYPDLPESKEVWDVVTQFFDKHLGVE